MFSQNSINIHEIFKKGVLVVLKLFWPILSIKAFKLTLPSPILWFKGFLKQSANQKLVLL